MLTPELNWKQLIIDHENSGLSIRDFCQLKGLRYHQFYHYRRKLSGKKLQQSSFARVKVTNPSPPKEPPRVVIYYNDLSLAIEGDQDLDLITRLCQKLGQE